MNVSVAGISRLKQQSGNILTVTVGDALKATETSFGTNNRRKPAVWCAPTGYTMRYYSYRRAVGEIHYRNAQTGQTAVWSGVVGSGFGFNSLERFNQCMGNSLDGVTKERLKNVALIKARIKMKSSDINLGVAFAERNATARLLGDTAKRIASAFSKLKKGQVRSAMNDLGLAHGARQPRGSNVPNKWLELQYGWKPLLSDVYGACSALSRAPRSDWRVTARAQVNEDRANVTTEKGVDNARFAGVCEARATVGAFARIDAIPQNDLTMSLASLGITNPLLIGWELVPFSFVVDWAFPVGQWLDSIDALLGYGPAYSSVTSFYDAHWRERGIPYTETDGDSWKNNWEGSQRVVEVDRTASQGVPLPTLPSFKDPRSLGHMANGLALLAGAFGRR